MSTDYCLLSPEWLAMIMKYSRVFLDAIGYELPPVVVTSHELEARIRGHSQFGRRLLWLDAGSDSELDYAYRHSSALIFASRCEGFGLPLVEAMQYGLPVLASDIPVFREIGGDYPIYIDTRDHRPLYDAIRGFDAKNAEVPRAQRNPRAWLSWSDSARMLLEKVGVLPAVRS